MESLGLPIPNDTPHAVSVSLPSWSSNVAYEEGERWVADKMTNGYPRFFVHLTIRKLEQEVLRLYGIENEAAILFPSRRVAKRCQEFFRDQHPSLTQAEVHILNLVPSSPKLHTNLGNSPDAKVTSPLSCVLYSTQHGGIAKQFWQHSGDGISSRRAEFLLRELQEGRLLPEGASPMPNRQNSRSERGPRRYQSSSLPTSSSANSKVVPTTVEINGLHKDVSTENSPSTDMKESTQYIEERFGRNLNLQLAAQAKLAIKRRIAGVLTTVSSDLESALNIPPNTSSARVSGLSEDDIYLFPCGMSAIFNTHRMLLCSSKPAPKKSICFGFPYIDTLKILQKWGPGCLFLGQGDESDCETLSTCLDQEESFQALFTEFPSNPLLRSPPLTRLKELCDTHSIPIVIDETIANYLNANLLPHASVLVSSLTKIFSGDSNVMGGCAILNPHSPHYPRLKAAFDGSSDRDDNSGNPAGDGDGYEDTYWPLDALFMERNSRDFASRIGRINDAAYALATLLARSPLIKQVYYPPLLPSRTHYDVYRTRTASATTSSLGPVVAGATEGNGGEGGGGGGGGGGGYGGLLSATFHSEADAIVFFDTLAVAKGPSLGTNFTLACPYTVLAHYGELEWAAGFGVERGLVRLSVGLEGREELEEKVKRAMEEVEKRKKG